MRQKTVYSLLLIMGLLCSVFTAAAQAQEQIDYSKVVVMQLGNPTALVKGEKTQIDVQNENVVPITMQDRTLVPAAFVARAFGAQVWWDGEKEKVTISYGDTLAEMVVGNTQFKLNRQPKPFYMDVPVQVMEDRTMLPLRVVAESILDKRVFWEEPDLIIIGENLPATIDTALIRQKMNAQQEKSVPVFAPAEKELENAVEQAEEILEQWPDEAYWLEHFVPKQSPRSNVQQPLAEFGYTADWQWDPARPEEILEAVSGVTYPNEKYPYQYKEVTVRSGKAVSVPYLPVIDMWDDPGYAPVEARIDYAKMNFLETKLAVLANAYYLTHDEKYARRIILSLDRWADYLPDYFITKGWNLQHPLSIDEIAEKANYKVEWSSDSNGFTNEITAVQVALYDKIQNSTGFAGISAEKGYDVLEHITNDFYMQKLDYLKEVIPLEVAVSSNLPGTYQRAAQLAILFHRADLISWLGEFMDLTISRNFKRDAMYPESFTYHYYYVQDNIKLLNTIRTYFEFYPEEIAEHQAVYDKLAGQLAFLQKALRVVDTVADPAGNVAPYGDCDKGIALKRNITMPSLLPAYGVAQLGGGILEHQMALNVGFIDSANHLQQDRNSIQLFAFGKELIGDVKYTRTPGRVYNNSVFAHNTVIVDGKNQNLDVGKEQVYGNDGHVFNGGNLTLFENKLDGVSMTEVFNNYAYYGETDRYQRVNLANTARETPYVIDAFVVEGGKRQEYMLHGSTQFDSDYSTDAQTRKLIGTDSQHPMQEGEAWTEFSSMWDSKENYYGIFRNVETADAQQPVKVTFRQKDGNVGVNMFLKGNTGTTLYLGESPASYRTSRPAEGHFYDHYSPFMMLRREGEDLKTVFLSVIEPFNETGGIQTVDYLEMEGENPDHVAVRITFRDGWEDVVLLNLNNPVITGKEDNGPVRTADGQFTLEGRAGIFSSRGNVKMIAGVSFQTPEQLLSSDTAVYSGTLIDSGSKLAGDSENYFVTEADLPEAMALYGRWMSVQFGEYQTKNVEKIKKQTDLSELFEIDHIEKMDGKTYIFLKDDPALDIKAEGSKELMRPHREFSAAPQFRIYTSAQ